MAEIYSAIKLTQVYILDGVTVTDSWVFDPADQTITVGPLDNDIELSLSASKASFDNDVDTFQAAVRTTKGLTGSPVPTRPIQEKWKIEDDTSSIKLKIAGSPDLKAEVVCDHTTALLTWKKEGDLRWHMSTSFTGKL